MKFPKLTALLGQAQIELHTSFFGNNKPFAKLDEEQLQSLENALEKNDTSALTEKITEHEATIKTLQENKTETQNALDQALQLNEISVAEGSSSADAIVALGEQCKKYGSSENRHVAPKNDGEEKPENKEGLVDGYFDPKAPHNQINP